MSEKKPLYESPGEKGKRGLRIWNVINSRWK